MDRFLREAEEILNFRTHNYRLNLADSRYQVSAGTLTTLQLEFLAGRPLAYLLQKAEFYHSEFHVNDSVLIPRPETELLVDLIIQKKRKFTRILDVGVGSGVILLSLLKEGVVAEGVGVDISLAALAVAKLNATRLRMNDLCFFACSDRLENVDGQFDLIVSNPPYIKAAAHSHLVQANVDKYEPQAALYLQDEAYAEWFSILFSQVKLALMPGGVFWMEGHELELQSQMLQLLDLGFKRVDVLKDYAGLERFLFAQV